MSNIQLHLRPAHFLSILFAMLQFQQQKWPLINCSPAKKTHIYIHTLECLGLKLLTKNVLFSLGQGGWMLEWTPWEYLQKNVSENLLNAKPYSMCLACHLAKLHHSGKRAEQIIPSKLKMGLSEKLHVEPKSIRISAEAQHHRRSTSCNTWLVQRTRWPEN